VQAHTLARAYKPAALPQSNQPTTHTGSETGSQLIVLDDKEIEGDERNTRTHEHTEIRAHLIAAACARGSMDCPLSVSLSVSLSLSLSLFMNCPLAPAPPRAGDPSAEA
jgi:hypothetical protein